MSATPLVLGDQGFLSVYEGSTPGHAPETLEVIRAELTRLGDGLGADEFRRAWQTLSTGVVFGAEGLRSRAYALTRDLTLFGRVREVAEVRAEISALSLEEVNAFLKNYHPLAGATTVTLGPPVPAGAPSKAVQAASA